MIDWVGGKEKTEEELKAENEREEAFNELYNDLYVDSCEDINEDDDGIPKSLQLLGILSAQNTTNDIWM